MECKALCTTLKILGYKPDCFKEMSSVEAMKNKHLSCWNEALKTTISREGKPLSRAELDKVLGRYSVEDALSFLPSF
jgi:hypothetical protein